MIKDDAIPDSDVDGQQRLTTLTFLLSVLRLHLPAKNAAALEKQLFQSGDVNLGVEDQPRLELRERDRTFFHDHIQSLTGLDALLSNTPPALETGAQTNLRDNAKALCETHPAYPRTSWAKAIRVGAARTPITGAARAGPA